MSATKISAIALLLLFAVACSTTDKRTKNLSDPNNIPTQNFSVKAGKDTVLITRGGMQVLVKNGTFTGDVSLQIKETLTLHDMVKYGLTTMANDRLLQTDGMFHIDAKDATGNQPKINKPIEINMPANNILDDPQLFTGKQGDDGFINWENPVDLKNQKAFKDIDIGSTMFNTRCASCHRINFARGEEPAKQVPAAGDTARKAHEDSGGYHHGHEGAIIGPSLLYINKRRSYNWFKSFTNNPQELLKEGDACAKCVVDDYGSVGIMPPQGLSDTEMEALWKYIIKESQKSEIDSNAIAFLDCYVTQTVIDTPKRPVSKFDWDKEYTAPSNWPTMSTEEFAKTKTETQQYVYEIEIESFGWYNIDRYTTPDYNGVETDVKITVLNADRFKTLSVVLVFEHSRSTVLLKPISNNIFGYDEEKIYLPDEPISIYVLGEQNDKLFYYLDRASISTENEGKKQLVSGIADLKPTTREEVEKLLDKQYQTQPQIKTNISPCGGVSTLTAQ